MSTDWLTVEREKKIGTLLWPLRNDTNDQFVTQFKDKLQ